MLEYKPPLYFEAPSGTFDGIAPTAKADQMTATSSKSWGTWPDKSLLRDPHRT